MANVSATIVDNFGGDTIEILSGIKYALGRLGSANECVEAIKIERYHKDDIAGTKIEITLKDPSNSPAFGNTFVATIPILDKVYFENAGKQTLMHIVYVEVTKGIEKALTERVTLAQFTHTALVAMRESSKEALSSIS